MATMTDRELLELAAKAAGIDGWFVESDEWYGTCIVFTNENDCNQEWNPLTDDGDALRLAVKLGNLDLQWVIAAAWQACETEAERMAYVCRAITKLAAETGKAMKEGHA